MDARKQAQQLAGMGRYGDSMLVHMNPKEVQGIASVMPMTINPKTGQPEMFVGALLGSLLGSAFLPGLAGGTMLGAAGAGAIGSALGTWAETGDLEKGIMSGIMGYGMGNIFGEIGSGATSTGEQVAADFTEAATQDIASQIGQGTLESGVPYDLLLEKGAQAHSQAAQEAAMAGFQNMSGMDKLGAVGSNLFSGDTINALTSSGSYLPIALGGGQLGAMQAQEDYEKSMVDWRAGADERKKKLYEKYPEQISYRSPYYGQQGGQIPYQDGGEVGGDSVSAYEPYVPPAGVPSLIDPTLTTPVPVAPMGSALERAAQFQQLTGLPAVRELQSPFAQTGVPAGTRETLISEGVDSYGNPTYTTAPNPVLTGPEGQMRPSQDYIPGMDAEFNYFPMRVRTASSLDRYGPNYSQYYDPSGVYSPANVGMSYNIYHPDTGNLMYSANPYGSEPTEITEYNTGPAGDIYDNNTYGAGRPNQGAVDSGTTDNVVSGTGSADYYEAQQAYARQLVEEAGLSYDDYVDWTTENPMTEGQTVDDHFLLFNESIEGDTDTSTQDTSTQDTTTKEWWENDFKSYEDAVASGLYELDENNNIVLDASGNPVSKTDDIKTEEIPDLPEQVWENDLMTADSGQAIRDYYIRWKDDPNFVGYGQTYEEFFQANYDVSDPSPQDPDLLYSDIASQETGLLGTTGQEIYNNWQKVKNDSIYANPYTQDTYPEGEDEFTGYWFLVDPGIGAGGAFAGDIEDIRTIGNPANAIRLTKAQWENREYPSGFGYYAEPSVPPQVDPYVPPIEPINIDLGGGGYGIGGVQLQGGGMTPNLNGFEQSLMPNEAEQGLMQQGMGMEMPSNQEDVVTLEAKMAILGQHSNPDQAIQAFIEKYGVDAFLQFRDMILKQQVPNAQTEGIISGQGGGMDDMVNGMIGNQQGIAVSPGEYIVPADVVSMLGDGSSDSGADRLDEMLQRIRVNKTGKTTQAEEIDEMEVLPK